MELTQLKYFLEAANTENMSQAARNLHITQPSLSKAISRLEEELGTRLFLREGRQIHLSDEGKAFLEEVRPAVSKLQAAARRFSGSGSGQKTNLTVGIWGNSDALTGCLQAFLRERSDVSITVKSHIENIVRLDIRDYDLLLYASDSEYFRKYKGTEILREEYLLAVPLSMAAVGAASVSLQELSALPLIASESSDELERLLLGAELPMNRVAVADDPVVWKNLVSAGVGVCLVAQSESGIFRNAGIVMKRISGVDLYRSLSICFKREKLLSDTGREFMRFVCDYFR